MGVVSGQWHLPIPKAREELCFGGVACVAAKMETDLALPDGNIGAGVAVGTSPGKDVAVRCLYNGETMTGALVGHCALGLSLVKVRQFFSSAAAPLCTRHKMRIRRSHGLTKVWINRIRGLECELTVTFEAGSCV